MKNERQAYYSNEGSAAFHAGKKSGDNPHTYDTEAYHSWRDGWWAARDGSLNLHDYDWAEGHPLDFGDR